jgi:hypothetical protein
MMCVFFRSGLLMMRLQFHLATYDMFSMEYTSYVLAVLQKHNVLEFANNHTWTLGISKFETNMKSV